MYQKVLSFVIRYWYIFVLIWPFVKWIFRLFLQKSDILTIEQELKEENEHNKVEIQDIGQIIQDDINKSKGQPLVKDFPETNDDGEKQDESDVTDNSSRVKAAEEFLHRIQTNLAKRDEDLSRNLKFFHFQEIFIFILFSFSAVLAILIVCVGIFFAFHGNLVIGVISGLLSALTGGGTILTKQMADRLDKKKGETEENCESNSKVLLAIQGALASPNPEEMSKLASWLRERASKEN
jgi:hypothetical protein